MGKTIKSSQIFCVVRKLPVEQKKHFEQKKARKKQMLERHHPRLTDGFVQRNTKQSQEFMKLGTKDLKTVPTGICGGTLWIS